MTWQVEQASDPSHAPSSSTSFSCATSSRLLPMGARTVFSLPSLSSLKVTLMLQGRAAGQGPGTGHSKRHRKKKKKRQAPRRQRQRVVAVLPGAAAKPWPRCRPRRPLTFPSTPGAPPSRPASLPSSPAAMHDRCCWLPLRPLPGCWSPALLRQSGCCCCCTRTTAWPAAVPEHARGHEVPSCVAKSAAPEGWLCAGNNCTASIQAIRLSPRTAGHCRGHFRAPAIGKLLFARSCGLSLRPGIHQSSRCLVHRSNPNLGAGRSRSRKQCCCTSPQLVAAGGAL